MNYYLGKLEMEKELCIRRSQRLEGPDDFKQAKVYKRPSTKAKVGGSLYVENLHPPPISAIRQDDIEVWLRREAYLNKCGRVFYKLIDKMKWLPMQHRFEIFEESLIYAQNQREDSLEEQKEHLEELALYAKKDIKKKFASEENLEAVKNTYHYTIFREKVMSKSDEIKSAMSYDHERLPSFISNTIELNMDILARSTEYDIHGNIELDQGFSFLYQIIIFFPMQFQKQVIKLTFKTYDSSTDSDDFAANLERVNDMKGKKGEKVPIQEMMTGAKPDEGEGDDETKAPMLTPIDSVSDFKNNSEFKNIISPQLKSSDWLHLKTSLSPQVKDYIKKQIGFLNHENPIDMLLKYGYELT